MRWLDLPDEVGTWFGYYRGKFQTYEYLVQGPRGLEYSRIPGVLFSSSDGWRWLGPIPVDPDAPQAISNRDVK